MKCFKVKVTTTDSSRDTTRSAKFDEFGDGGYNLDCKNGILYIFGDCFSDVEKVVDKDSIENIECVGIGYTVEE